ncbi:hypothetical protein PS645_01048 [Pseudomonas fluorescens]|uniref:RING-type E3 ubiquitin transferase n=1 Tax=Pseudomonas fluorescens TaxID=294 RepID=A0A5E6QM19_PSEFL|nr:DUF6543 domain-containing protein [Pseudomonas fluorescens]VVM56793.1 hypothetical protein PS645_01048 [Pseudomonas fluorescens]
MSAHPSNVKEKKPEISESIHGEFLETAIPQWLIDASPQRRAALKKASTVMPQWYQNASAQQRKTLNASIKAGVTAQAQLDKTMASFKDVDAFAEPLLVKALKDQFGVEVDVKTTYLTLRRPLAISILEIEIASFEFLTLTMLQAALHNFEAWECKPDAYHKTSGFLLETTVADTYTAAHINLSVSQFLSLCRKLDIGARYQAYLQSFFHPPELAAASTLRQHFIATQKATMKAAADQALLTKDILPEDHTMILSVINGEVHPWMGDKQVWFRDMSLMKQRMTGCVAFVISEKYRYAEELILYIPHDPEHPLKRYTWSQMKEEFKRLLTARDAAAPDQAAPTEYQRFLSQFLAYDHRPYYFGQFVQKAADSPAEPSSSPWIIPTQVGNAGLVFRIKEFPPERRVKLEPVADPYIGASTFNQKGGPGWSENQDLWDYLYKHNCAKVLADARSHAVPSDDVDVNAREAKLAHLLQVGLLGLNMVSMFVPVLGEVMMVAMAGQLLYETLEGAVEWGEGDKKAARAHLIDVAENLATVAVMAGIGAGVGKFVAAKAEPVIESLDPVTMPNGKTRLWKPDLSAYKRDIVLSPDAGPNALGQYKVDGKTYIRLGDTVVEQTFDASLNKWRITHPDPDAYQPVLEGNGLGAWRHSLERPMQWDRLTLLRRMGHAGDMFSDEMLVRVADVSGVSDNTLRKMHLDHAAPPPELTDAMNMFKADLEAGQVIEQLQHLRPLDDRYFHALKLLTEMPRWPSGRVLEVFEQADLSGKPIKYGAQGLPRAEQYRPPIKVSRSDVLNGYLSERIVAALDESEITGLLGGEGARVLETTPEELDKQFADYAQTRQTAIFDSLYLGTEPPDTRMITLQRECPGLGRAAAQEVLAHGSADELARLDTTRRAPLRMLEEARWYARQERQTRAFAGLRSENIASADSRRLALHALQNLQGWPGSIRLEVRTGSPSGTLLDSIGSETAPLIKYLVKDGPHYQAFNERGETLNSIPRHGDNFYASVMHALPDGVRAAIEVPHVSQSSELQRKIIDYADSHRNEASTALESQAKSFKPPVRVNNTLVGYYASGRGRALDGPMMARVEALYPAPEQADAFIRTLQGKTDKQIFHVLQARLREWESLTATLDAWTGTPQQAAYWQKSQAAQALKASWRNAPLATQMPAAARLSLECNEPWPQLTADFSHVRELRLKWRATADDAIDALLSRFSNVRDLSLDSRESLFSMRPAADCPPLSLPQSVVEMRNLERLAFFGRSDSLAADFLTKLNSLTSLETLRIGSSGANTGILGTLDLTPLNRLKSLTIDSPFLTTWPAYVENMPQLERLDLSRTSIAAIPETFYTGHEKLWAGLSLDWSKVPYETFERSYQFVQNYSGPLGHLVDVNEMVSGYCRGELNFLLGQPIRGDHLLSRILDTWDSAETKLAAVRALSAEHAGLFRGFYRPSATAGLRQEIPLMEFFFGAGAKVFRSLERNWRGLVRQRYGAAPEASLLELDMRVGSTPTQFATTVRQLPSLPAGSFSHVETVRMNALDVPVEQLQGFIKAFSKTQTLEIGGSGLTELPMAANSLPELTRLDLHDNNIAVTPHVQAQFNALTKLEYLDVNHNPLSNLDVRALTELKALNLSATKLQAWPAGAEYLPQLTWLDLRDNELTSLSPDVFVHDDTFLKTDLTRNPLDEQAQQLVTRTRQRIEGSRGLPDGALERLSREMTSSDFPPAETAWTIANHLLPLPDSATEGVSLADRLQRLGPTLTEGQALERVEQMRGNGLSDRQIDAQISQWHQSCEVLTRQLNDWLSIAELRTERSLVSAQTRALAASRIRGLWQEAVIERPGVIGQALNLNGLQTGDLPVLGTQFPGVTALDLTGVGLTAQGSNGFLSAFPNVLRLCLDSNALTTLPEAVREMRVLGELELAANRLSSLDANAELPIRGGILRRIDLSHNLLDSFNSTGFLMLEELNLANNALTEWPEGALNLQHLRRLDLSGNTLTRLPEELLNGHHEQLAAGVDVSDNSELSGATLSDLVRYSDANGEGAVMGISREELVRRSAEADGEWDDTESAESSDEESENDSDQDDHGAAVLPVEALDPQQPNTADAALEPWLANTGSELMAARREIWGRLASEDQHERFFHLIAMLRDTHEFRFARADLTRRLWGVMDAAAENTELRELLFHNAETHGTCIDGRILTFSEIEGRVFVYHALRNVSLGQPLLKGRALLQLSRQLFRLDRVETLAEAAAVQGDRAEVRLQYRIGLTSGWGDGLDLPGQPAHMAFANPISGAQAARIQASILEAERSDALLVDMVSREYWTTYLAERYPEEFSAINTALDDERLQRFNEIEDRLESGEMTDEEYRTQLDGLAEVIKNRRSQQLVELTRREIRYLQETASETGQTAPGSPQPGPSRLP